jgi:hypothetical protein
MATHKYKVELFRIFRGCDIPLSRPEYLELPPSTCDRTLICKAKEAFGFGGIKSRKQDFGDTITLRFEKNKTHKLSIQFCS